MNKEKEYKFKGKVIRCLFDTEDYKIYALDVDKDKYIDVKHNKYGNVAIQGELPELNYGIEYEITATEQISKYGTSYKVLNIKREQPTTQEDMYLFLSEILTANQTKVLWENYPDIVQRVKEDRLDDIDLNKLKGIKEYTFEVIKRKIIENFCLADLIIEFKGYLSLSMLKKIYNKYTSIDVLKTKLRENPYKCLCGLAGVGFKTADSILLEIEKVSKKNKDDGKEPIIDFKEDLKSSSQRCLACLIHLLEENENDGHTKMNIADLRSQLIKLVPACSDYFVEMMKDKAIYYNKDNMEVALKKTYKQEYYIAQQILANLHSKNNIWDYDIEKYRIVNGFSLSDEQMNAVDNLCKYTISILNGSGGTGKTASTQAMINLLLDNNKSFQLFSPTGKAAKVLSEYTHQKASTIHRGLGYNPSGFKYEIYVDENGIEVNENEIKDKQFEAKKITEITNWSFNKRHKLQTDVVIIDEFSMVDISLFEKVLEAIDFRCTKLLLIGDNAQLPSVSCGNLLHDFMESKLIPTTTLTKVFRYGEGGLMKVATDVRFCQTYLDKSMKNSMTVFGGNKDYTFVDLASDIIPQNVVALYKKLLQQGYGIEDIQVLTAKNVGDCGTVALNNLIQKVANPNYGSKINMQVGKGDNTITYYEGDIIIQKVNNYKAPIVDSCGEIIINEFTGKEETAFIANGENGIIKEIFNSYMIIDFDGIRVKYFKTDMNMVGLGYSITIHKSQGSSIKVVILCTPQSHIFMLNSNLIYVGLTRMKEKCYHLGTLDSVNMAVVKKANLIRNTFMQQLLLTMTPEEYNIL